MNRLAALLLFFLLLSPTLSIAEVSDHPTFTGTVNIIFANANGIVALTDSNQTVNGLSTSRVPGQKLFRLDEHTVCTIAGFASVSHLQYPTLTTSAAAVLDRYVKELAKSGGSHSFREKLGSLEFLLDQLLASLGNMERLDKRQTQEYVFELVLAGYDLDGTVRISKVRFDANLSAEGVFRPVITPISDKIAGRELVHETAGIGGAAVENILEYPAQFADEPEIKSYAQSKSKDQGASLHIADMVSLAKSLAQHSAVVNRDTKDKTFWRVGGPNQIAVFEKGALKSIDLPTEMFEPRKLDMAPFFLVMDTHLSTSSHYTYLIQIKDNKIWLFLKSSFDGGRMALDGVYYFEDKFRNVTLYYDGGVLGFDQSNQVSDCVLSLGPHADRASAAVQQLMARFPRNTVW
jgi:hypothetical protein